MTLLVGILFAVVVIFDIYIVSVAKKQKKQYERFAIMVGERFDEIENYAYTDIRELYEFLDKIKLDYKKYDKTRKN